MQIPTELFEYINLPDSSFGWRAEVEERGSDVSRIDLDLRSQTWQGMEWSHSLVLFVPGEIQDSNTAMLIIGADGQNSALQNALGRLYAARTRMICAFLYDVPNQPLFDGKIEDELIAHTLIRHLDTGEPHWPLLLPMTKSALAAMTAITEFCSTRAAPAPGKFVVAGASKRGWTSWLTAVVDDRVAGIAPEVFDNLKLFAQMPHQMGVFDSYSEQISDYSESGLMERMMTPAGYHLAQIIDPYTYRDRITVPKLIINGSNDPYWATDAMNLYWDGLAGQKNVLYLPNQGHSINDPSRIDSTLTEFAMRVGKGEVLPTLAHTCEVQREHVEFNIEVLESVHLVSCWIASSSSLDFRLSVRTKVAMLRQSDSVYRCSVERRGDGNLALFGEAWLKGTVGLFPLSTPVEIVKRDA